jgi:dihydroflavonol-4-reductase
MAQALKVMVSGGSGYIAGFCIAQLLREGHEVHTTVRRLSREPQVREALAKIAPDQTRLHFFEADLTSDSGWAEAVAGCSHVLHVASPLPTTAPKSDDELVVPARDGALRVLRAARDAGVVRTVLTSSTAAITYGTDAGGWTRFTEADWTDPAHPDTSAYIRSKTIAERAAWDFMAAEGGAMEMVTVNPGAVLGPVLGSDFSASIEIVKKLLAGDFPGCPRLGFPMVDVRDIADLHVRAMTHKDAAGQRYLGACDFWWMEDVARVLKDNLGLRARKVPTGRLPSWLVRLLANFDPVTRSVVFELDRLREAPGDKARTQLAWSPRPVETSIIDTAESLIREGVVRV